MRKFVESMSRVARGGVSPREVSLAVFLGLLAGFVTGWNASLAVLLLAALLSNVSTRVFVQCWALAAALSWGLASVTCHLGYLLLERTALGAALAPYADHLAVVLFDLDRYALVGGAALALALALPCSLLAAWLVHRLNARNAGPSSLSGIERWVAWLVHGGSRQASLASPPRWLRPLGPTGLMAVVTFSILLTWFGGPHLLGRQLLARLSLLNQAQVDAGSVQLSLRYGLIEITDLRLADPDHLERDRLRIGYLTAVLNPSALVRGRVAAEKMLVEGLETDVPRATRARPYGVALAGFAADESDTGSTSSQGKADRNELYLADCLKDWPTLGPRLSGLGELVAQIERLAAREEAVAETARQTESYSPPSLAGLRELRSDFGRPKLPQLHIKALRAKDLPPSWGLGTGAVLELSDVSSNPALVGRPTKLQIAAVAYSAELSADLNLQRGEQRHAVRLQAANLDIASALAQAPVARGVKVQAGELTVSGAGWITRQGIELPLAAELGDLRLELTEARRPGGVSDLAWNGGRNYIVRLDAALVLEGPWDAPRVRLDTPRLAEQYKAALLAGGEPIASAAPVEESTEQADPVLESEATAEGEADPALESQATAEGEPLAERVDHVSQVGAKADRYAGRAPRLTRPAEETETEERPLAEIVVPSQETIAPETVPAQARITGGLGNPAAGVRSASEDDGDPAPAPAEVRIQDMAPDEEQAPAEVANELRYPGVTRRAARESGERRVAHQSETAPPRRRTLRLPASRTAVAEDEPAELASPAPRPRATSRETAVRLNDPAAADEAGAVTQQPAQRPTRSRGDKATPPPIGFQLGYDADSAPSPKFAVTPRPAAGGPMARRARAGGPDESAWQWNLPDLAPGGENNVAQTPQNTVTGPPAQTGAAQTAGAQAARPQARRQGIMGGRTAEENMVDQEGAEQDGEAGSPSRLARWSQSVKRGFKRLWDSPDQSDEATESMPEVEIEPGREMHLPQSVARVPAHAEQPPTEQFYTEQPPANGPQAEQPHENQGPAPRQQRVSRSPDQTDPPFDPAPAPGEGDRTDDSPSEREEPAAWYQFWR